MAHIFAEKSIVRKHAYVLTDYDWLGWLDSDQRDDGVKVRCLTAWLQPIIKK